MTVEEEVDSIFTDVYESMNKAYNGNIPKHVQDKLNEMKKVGDEIKESERLHRIFVAKPEVFQFFLNMKKEENKN